MQTLCVCMSHSYWPRQRCNKFCLQDTPAAKVTYSASVTVPAPLQALMSAVPLERAEASSTAQAAGTSTFHFEQKVPVPTYLIALAVGNLESRKIGPISRVSEAELWCNVQCILQQILLLVLGSLVLLRTAPTANALAGCTNEAKAAMQEAVYSAMSFFP